jgi:hypothetical protein
MSVPVLADLDEIRPLYEFDDRSHPIGLQYYDDADDEDVFRKQDLRGRQTGSFRTRNVDDDDFCI